MRVRFGLVWIRFILVAGCYDYNNESYGEFLDSL